LADSRMLRAVRAEGKLLFIAVNNIHNFILDMCSLTSYHNKYIYCLQLSTVSSINYSTTTKKTKLCSTWKEMDEKEKVSRS